jgi:hypothetical protein
MRRRHALTILLALVLAIAAGAAAYAQDWFGRRRSMQQPVNPNVEYDGRLTFARIRFDTGFACGVGRRGSNGELPWAHDYPTADIHLMKIMQELSLAPSRTDGSNVFATDEPELLHYPIAYVSEPGCWQPTDDEVKGLRNYMRKGGFVIFDDFRGDDWHNLEEQMRKVLPDLRFVVLEETHPIFNSFFEIKQFHFGPGGFGYGEETYYGIFEDNDPKKRLMAVAGLNQDLGEYWEFSDSGYVPIDLSNEAYKFGVNYYIYGMTH